MTNRTALITGGTRGIGKAISIALKKAGYQVVANYAGNDAAAKEFEQETQIPTFKFSVANESDCAQAIADIENKVAPIDILVNNAGITRDGMLHKLSSDKWLDVINTNLNSLYHVTRPIWTGMRERKWGRIVNISSINSQSGQMGQTNYSAAKAGIHGFTKALAQEGAFKGITVNTIAPGYINTEMVAAVPEQALNQIIAKIPMGRLGEADEIAAGVEYLVSERAGFVTGSCLSINGGHHMY